MNIIAIFLKITIAIAALVHVHVCSLLEAYMRDLLPYSLLSTVATLRGHMELQYNNKTPLERFQQVIAFNATGKNIVIRYKVEDQTD